MSFHWVHDYYFFAIMCIGGGLSLVIGMIIFTYKYCHQECREPYAFGLSIVASLSESLFWLLHGILAVMNLSGYFEYFNWDNIWYYEWFIAENMILAARTVGLGYFMYILYWEFRETPYSISFKWLIVYLSLCITMIISGIIGQVYPNNMANSMVYMSVLGVSMTGLLILCIWKFCKFGDFLSKNYNSRRKTVTDFTEYVGMKQSFEDGIDCISIKASKLFMVGIIWVISYQCYTILYLFLNQKISGRNVIISICGFLVSIVAPWFIMLTFPFMNSWYECCFIKCHTCTRDFCTMNLRRKKHDSTIINGSIHFESK